MALERIGSLIDRLVRITPPDRALEETVVSFAERELGITLAVSEVHLRGDTIYIDAPPHAKSELLLRRAQLLRELAERFGDKKKVREIR